jgi:hypothetical protein
MKMLLRGFIAKVGTEFFQTDNRERDFTGNY